jgi:hypothetical protein
LWSRAGFLSGHRGTEMKLTLVALSCHLGYHEQGEGTREIITGTILNPFCSKASKPIRDESTDE